MKETHRCPECSVLFFPLRSDAVYCSPRCRKRAQRAKTNGAKDEASAIYRQLEVSINALLALGAARKLRVITQQVIMGLPDDERRRLYESIEEDLYRLKRD